MAKYLVVFKWEGEARWIVVSGMNEKNARDWLTFNGFPVVEVVKVVAVMDIVRAAM